MRLGELMHRCTGAVLVILCLCRAQVQAEDSRPIVIKPARVFDGVAVEPHAEWLVVVRGEKITAAGPAKDVEVPANARTIDLPNATLLPGLIEAHCHLLLHPYNETSWNDQ